MINTIKKTARTAGILYLLVALFGGFAHFFVRMTLIIPDNAKETAKNIMNSEMLFRSGFVADIIQLTCFLFLLLTLYKLLKNVNSKYAKAMLILAITGVPIACLNMLNQYAVLFFIKKTYLNIFEKDQIDALAMLFLDLHNTGYAIAHIFFGLWLFPLGYLVFKSGFFPNLLGILLMIATLGYLINMLTIFLFPEYEAITSFGALYSGIAEMIFIIWLLVKGVRLKAQPQ